MEIKESISKTALRREYLAKRDAQENQERILKSRQILKQLKESNKFAAAEVILTYVDFRSEVLTTPLIRELLNSRDKTVFTPKVLNTNIEFFKITTMEQLSAGNMGIMEPRPQPEHLFTEAAFQQNRCLMIVPGSVFDEGGGRIGYGGGFYDRFLIKYLGMQTVALAFECQIAPSVPREEHDVLIKWIVTEKRMINYKEK